MAVDGDARSAEAVSSLADPTLPIEIIVVNTGSGSVAEALGKQLDRLILVESSIRRLPGGTRNLGLAEASAPIVAFLAADCLATPGWAERRIAAHGLAEAVASAILPAPEANGHVSLPSLATHMLTYCRRDPALPAPRTTRYGASYRREIFQRHGTFLEDRLIGEDTEFNARLATPPAWAADVVTLHRNPSRLHESLVDGWRRGGQLYQWMMSHSRYPATQSIRWAAVAALEAMALVKYASSKRRGSLLAAAPLVLALVLARVGGALAQAVRRPPPIAG